MIDILVRSLKSDEDLGKSALESFIDLSQFNSEFFNDSACQIVKIIADIIRAKEFEVGTKSQASEIVLNLSEKMPAIMRKVNEMSLDFVPALFQLLTECEEDQEEWKLSLNDENGTGSDAYSIAVSAISRLSLQMKENFTLKAAAPLIQQCIAHQDWKIRQAGYLAIGLIAESCKDHFKKSIQESVTQVCQGIQDQHFRVQYASLSALANLLLQLSPEI